MQYVEYHIEWIERQKKTKIKYLNRTVHNLFSNVFIRETNGFWNTHKHIHIKPADNDNQLHAKLSISTEMSQTNRIHNTHVLIGF